MNPERTLPGADAGVISPNNHRVKISESGARYFISIADRIIFTVACGSDGGDRPVERAIDRIERAARKQCYALRTHVWSNTDFSWPSSEYSKASLSG